MNLVDLRARLQELNVAGYITTERSGPTGVGHTLETRLGLSRIIFLFPTSAAMWKSRRLGRTGII